MLNFINYINLRALCVLCGLFVFINNASAADIPYQFTDSQQEARYKQLLEELRCLVCQNQSLADSNADLAQDFREEIYNRILAGQSDPEIIEYLVARYGDFVLYKPPLKIRTVLLWSGPFLLLVMAISILVMIARRRQNMASVPLTDEEKQKFNQLINRSSGGN